MRLCLQKKNGNVVKWSFMSKNQLPFFMVYEEEWNNGEVTYAWVLFNSKNWIGV